MGADYNHDARIGGIGDVFAIVNRAVVNCM